MHINDWSDEFLSKFDVNGYYQNLVTAKIQSPMIYLQSHTGLCHYPTKSGKTHTYFAKNPRALNELIDKCKQGGMKVVGYYSLIFNNWAADTYPEWEMVNADGTPIFEEGNEKSRCFKKLEIAANGYNLDLCKYPKKEEEILSIKDTIINYKKHSGAAEEKINSTLAKITEILGIEL